jgi:hypothetical protein
MLEDVCIHATYGSSQGRGERALAKRSHLAPMYVTYGSCHGRRERALAKRSHFGSMDCLLVIVRFCCQELLKFCEQMACYIYRYHSLPGIIHYTVLKFSYPFHSVLQPTNE